MKFRKFESRTEEQLATDIIARIDQGEKRIFQGVEGSSDFTGVIDKLFYHSGDIYGTYCSRIYNGNLRIQIGFNTDMPKDIHEELLLLIVKARSEIKAFTSIWYPADNKELDKMLLTQLPWKTQSGNKTHELTFKRKDLSNNVDIPKNISIVPFSDEYLEATCSMLDKSLSHTFDAANSSVFMNNKENNLASWLEKAIHGDCCIMIENGELAGAYILKGVEIDFIAIACEKQGKGLGSLLLHHAKKHIFATSKEEPFLYCMDRNSNALRFYLREGMKRSGYSGYAFFEADA
jgi:ribosomal protein S18 acetylase RimI-like enzyme